MSVVTLGSNLASLKAQRRLSQGTAQLSTSFDRLSSGLRINRASDDAAGLAISESLKASVRVFNQGIRNFNDGISLLNIADSAVESLSNIVIRLKELAEQSANGVYSHTQRAVLDKEAQVLSREYSRIVLSTKFNGVSLLDGSLGSGIRLQGGYGLDGSILSSLGGAIGTGAFGSATSYQVGLSTESVTVGDFNGDGILDLAGADADSSQISVLMGRGDGTFGFRMTFQVGNGTASLQAADVNGDGVLDIVSADRSSNTVSILIGNGNGTFAARTSYQTGINPSSVTTGDFNKDGILDIVTADESADSLSILLGTGLGTFHARTSFAVGAGPISVQTADFNGDGILDLISGDAVIDDTVSILIGNGDGTFKAVVSYVVGNHPTSVKTGDFNGDGIVDVVSANTSEGTLAVLIGNGDGSFNSRLINQSSSPSFVNIGDFNGDGILDLVSSDQSNDALNVHMGNGDGTFQARTSYVTGDFPVEVHIGDFNGDGVLDLVSSDIGNDRLSVLIGQTQDGASPLLPFDLSTLAGARQALPVFDRKIQQIAAQRGQIGGFQSRIQVGLANLQSASENYMAADGRISNVDIAEESSKLVSLNILQRVASSVLSQANLQPQLALRLLQPPNP
ncbi:MAG: VCBS repeat-containing protein [Deltaproteobacteria bacterium]|nr:VCBS repeat-containing protein [Deltaproteobacteria bacterium]